MQVPTRRADRRPRVKVDSHLTVRKFDELKNNLERLVKVVRPRLAEEVKRLSTTGDYSENAGYQAAKGKLRGLNARILEIEDLIRRAVIIEPKTHSDIVDIGHLVTVEVGGRQKQFRILGSTESDPAVGVISHVSPLGAALINRRLGEVVRIKLGSGDKEYKIIKIE
jgi:transcription elongation factor GreA